MKSYPVLYAELKLNETESVLVEVLYEERQNTRSLNVIYEGVLSSIEQEEFKQIAMVYKNIVGIADIANIGLITISKLPLSSQVTTYSQIICEYKKDSDVKWDRKCFSIGED
jgi:hypothetical protein